MHDKGDDRGRDGPQGDAQRLGCDVVLLQHRLDQQHRAQSDEDVLAEEGPDIVGAGGVGAEQHAALFGDRAGLGLFGAFDHRRDQRPDHGGVSAEREQAQRGADLTRREISCEQPTCGQTAQAGDDRPRPGLHPRGFQKADEGQDEEGEADVARVVERLAQRADDGQRFEAATDPRDHRRRGHHDQGVEPRQQPEQHDRNAEQAPHGVRSGGRTAWSTSISSRCPWCSASRAP